VEWLVNHYYLQGVRNFRTLNYRTGTVVARHETTSGKINYRFEAVLRKYQTELGRLIRLDEAPTVKREGNFSLDGMRNAAMAQAALDVCRRESRLERCKAPFLQCLLLYGTAGLAVWGKDSLQAGHVQPVVEVVPPWELIPLPVKSSLHADVEGVIRLRYLSMDELKKKVPAGAFNGIKPETIPVPYGQTPEDSGDATGGSASFSRGNGQADASAIVSGTSEKAKEDAMMWDAVKTAEVFIPNGDGTLARYILWCGGKIVQDVRYEEDKEPPMMPLSIARYIDTGSFYGRAFVSVVRPTNVEVEYLLKQLFENAQDIDQFGILCLPTDMGIDVQQLKNTGKPRYLQYQPDLTVPEHKPFALRPWNIGDWPGKVANMGRDILSELSGQGEMFEGGAPGRVDSAQGLGVIQETSSIPLSPTAESIARAYEGLYRAMLGLARDQWGENELAFLTHLDDSLVGVKMDPETGGITLDKSAVPHPRMVDLTIKAALPKSMQQRKLELLTMLERQLVSPRDFRRISQVEGLGFPLANRAEYENYRKAILHNILLFGDGKEPGRITMSATSDNPEIHLETLGDFMAKPEFMLASEAVREAFEQRKVLYENMLGQKLPEGMDNFEDSALMAEAQEPPGPPQM